MSEQTKPVYGTKNARALRAAVLVALTRCPDDPSTYVEIRDVIRHNTDLHPNAETVGAYARKLEAEGLVSIGEGMESRTKFVSLTPSGRVAAAVCVAQGAGAPRE